MNIIDIWELSLRLTKECIKMVGLAASRSFLYMCDHHIQNPETHSSRVPETYPTKPGESIYIHPSAMPNFFANYLPKLVHPFILVSGDSDMTVPDDLPGFVEHLESHPLLLCWYVQNCTRPSNKLRQLPIGLDFHTLEKGPHEWGPQQSLEDQQRQIFRLRNANIQKKRMCYANFQFLMNTRYAHDRRDAIDKVPKHLVYYEPTKIPRNQSWNTMIQYMYVLSPHGNGLDCHRTWEALALGCIPIIKSSTLDPLFKGLPVLIVKSWSDITQELLDQFQPDRSQLEKLELKYWKRLLTQ